MPESQTLLGESRALCRAHVCPKCGVAEHVTAERVIIADTSVTQCHCRACGHSWHPQVEPEMA